MTRIFQLDKRNQILVLKKLLTLQNNPSIGKPLKFDLKGLRSLRAGKYRIIYEINDKILLSTLKHRKKAYREMQIMNIKRILFIM